MDGASFVDGLSSTFSEELESDLVPASGDGIEDFLGTVGDKLVLVVVLGEEMGDFAVVVEVFGFVAVDVVDFVVPSLEVVVVVGDFVVDVFVVEVEVLVATFLAGSVVEVAVFVAAVVVAFLAIEVVPRGVDGDPAVPRGVDDPGDDANGEALGFGSSIGSSGVPSYAVLTYILVPISMHTADMGIT